jgi:alpha-ribazole phosphatase
MAIYLIRHTTPEIATGIAYGQTDLDVVDTFEEEVKIIQEKTGEIGSFRFFSSPLKRCKKLAESLSADPRKIYYDERLLELSFGDWEMQAWDALPQDEMKAWMNDFVSSSAPNGETFLQLYERVSDFWDQMATEEVDDAVVVSHSGPLHTIVGHILEIPLDNVYNLKMNYGQVIRITKRWNDKFEIELL